MAQFLLHDYTLNHLTMLQYESDIILTDNLDETLQTSRKYAEASARAANEFICILRCTQGSMQVELNDTQQQLHAGELLVCLPHFLLGKYMRTPDYDSQMLCVSLKFFREIAIASLRSEPKWIEKQQYIQEHPVIRLDSLQYGLLDSYFNLLQIYMKCEQTIYRKETIRAVAKATMLEIMGYLDACMIEEGNEIPTLGQKDTLLRNFIDMLRKPDYRQRKVQYYADILSVTPKYLSAVCKERSGKTASEWIEEFTMEEIRRLLLHSDMTAKEIGFQLGFTDTSYFCQYVKKHFGKTTNQLRSGK